MVEDVSRAKQALPSESTSAAAQALWSHLADFGRKIQANSKGGSDLVAVRGLCRSAIELFSDCDALAAISQGIAEKLVAEDIQSRLGALQQTMNVFGTSFQGAGAAENVAGGAKITKGLKDESAP